MPNIDAKVVSELGGHRIHVTIDGRELETPPVEHLAFYIGVAAMAGVGLIEWPVAVALGVGHVLIDITRRPALEALGEALAEAG